MKSTNRHQLAPTPVRLPDDLKAALKSEAKGNDRSLNGEIVNRLRSTLKDDMREILPTEKTGPLDEDFQARPCAFEGGLAILNVARPQKMKPQ